jgi:hypothetical protein
MEDSGHATRSGLHRCQSRGHPSGFLERGRGSDDLSLSKDEVPPRV